MCIYRKGTSGKSLSGARLDTSMSPSKMGSSVSPEKQAKLRDLLGNRRVTPVKSSAPGSNMNPMG